MATAKVYRSNRSQAVRIPKALEWPENVTDVEVIQGGWSRILSPVDMVWDYWFTTPPVDESFPEREQPENLLHTDTLIHAITHKPDGLR